jgi:hypothetical protein
MESDRLQEEKKTTRDNFQIYSVGYMENYSLAPSYQELQL